MSTAARPAPRFRAALALAAAGVIAASLLPFAARRWWVFELASHFRMQYVVAAALLIAVLGYRRQWLWCAGLAASLAVSAQPLLPYLRAGTPTAVAASTGPTVKVLTVNLLFDNHSTERLFASIRDESPDVIVFVEFTPKWATLVRPLHEAYPNRLEIPFERSTGVAVFSRLPLDSARMLPLGVQPAIEARVRLDDRSFTLIGVHLRSPTSGWRAGQRNWQYELLARRRAQITGPLLVTGDFNTTPYSPYFTDWLERTGLNDTRAGRGLTWSWPTFLPLLGIPIDHCVVSDDFRVIAERRLPAFGSDHFPIVTELALETPAAPSPYVRNEGGQ
ncbi:MAG TPA: endonuclease/exonuclease/phosphatase family protein [Gammaproteobacteria bacterium]|nr:endonuclease/exonuclease/phosphatase family protein [Gammaproteobacteria bacterium]